MLSRPQQILLKRAQTQAGIDDSEYRDTLEMLAGCRSSKDAAMEDRHLDIILAYFESIFWRRFDAGEVTRQPRPSDVFIQRGFWARRNPRGNTSRDRYIARDLTEKIAQLESQLAALDCGPKYCEIIARSTGYYDAFGNPTQAHRAHLYVAALERTLRPNKSRASD